MSTRLVMSAAASASRNDGLRIKFGVTFLLCVFVLAACGSDGPAASSMDTVATDVAVSTAPHTSISIDPRAKYWEPLIRSEDYTGQIAVMFKESAGVRFKTDSSTIFRSRSNADLTALNTLFAQHPEAAVQMGLPNITQDELDQRIAEIRVSEGYPMTDWGSFYIVNVMDPDEALEILSGLVTLSSAEGLVWFAHPVPRAYPAGIQIPNINPGPGQDYLKDVASTGGLNVKAAWDAGLDGSGVILLDNEGNWNIGHTDLPLKSGDFVSKDTGAALNSYAIIQHGTAVAGVIVGKDNGMGITGIAPKSKLLLGQTTGTMAAGSLSETLVKKQALYADGSYETHNMKPGDVFILELQTAKPGSEGCKSTSANPSNGCVPLEAYQSEFLILKDLTNYGGIVVIEGAGNGGLDLDNPANQVNVDLSKDSSGAIMVGASTGGSTVLNGKHTLEKAPYSNCGSRVDVFAWGLGVTTTGYGDHPISAPGSMKVDPAYVGGQDKYVDPNQSYTASFAGTSSATAIIAGSAALLQQYAKQLYKDPKSACAIKTWEYVYLSSQQMRDVMVKSGTASKPYNSDPQLWNNYKDPNPGCNIGTQPDLAKAMQIIKDGCEGKAGGIKATVKTKDLTTYCPKATLQNPNPKKESWCPDYGPLQPAIGKMMDLDGDGRADLISFSKDRKWYVDLSSTGPTQFNGMPFPKGKPKDNFGYWDLIFDLSSDTTIAKDAMIFPVVMDYNTDGKADLALYDSIHGKWYVSFTTGNTLNTNNAVNEINPWPGWTMTLDYSTQPHWKPYSRPVPGDYDGQDNDPYTFDNFKDIGLQTLDGWLLIDFGGASIKANYGSFDKTIQYLTDSQLTQAPAWAWLPGIYLGGYNYADTAEDPLMLKSPDGIGPKMSNRLYWWIEENKELYLISENKDYGDNDLVLSKARFQTKSYVDLGLKRQCVDSGFWSVATDQSYWDDIIYVDPYVDFGDLNCRPAPGDYDGDGYDDRAVQCGNTWNIAYTGSTYPININATINTVDCDGKPVKASQSFRSISEPASKNPLPGYVYPGGVSFKNMKDIFGTVNYLCPTVNPTGNTPPCSLQTMTPAPVGPYFPQCVDAVKKTYAADTCTDPAKKVTCEQMRIKQAQCIYQQ